MARGRADLALVARGLVTSRARAQAAIHAGKVTADGRSIGKPGELVDDHETLVVADAGASWVSRGALKLIAALDHFGLSPAGRICLDIGASTGGFTEVLLARDAALVHAVDVGHGQMAPALREDSRVRLHEGVNARDLSAAGIQGGIGALVCDVSFIGLRKVLPAGLALCAPGAFAVALIKPQFEAGPEAIGKGGIVRDAAVHERVCGEIGDWFAQLPGWRGLGIIPSPIEGGDGNREFLIAGMKHAH
ncbi:TlyA family RNA methyltransferase [Acidiphilium sp. C61]|uniref:TlyA family RNA methyltransferase n=1 Tax=Acidiphilium sp. C61 TaxID=1671485 RepID=UPI00157A5D85|nr:TlyA family RNA methyltransferase [Acidiphilium sp. C61]